MNKESFKTSEDIRKFLVNELHLSLKNIRLCDPGYASIGVQIGRCTISTRIIKRILENGLMFFIDNGIPTVYTDKRAGTY